MPSPGSLQIALLSLTITFSPLIPPAGARSVNDESGLKENSAVRPSVTRELFGTTPDGTQVDEYTLTNKHGVRVAILTYGGIIQSIVVPDKNGQLGDIALGFDRLEDYMKSGHYFGAVVGRYANRIANGQFSLDGKQFEIPANSGPNAVHGGTKGFNQEVWAATPSDSIRFVRSSSESHDSKG
jgi:galactose mutarotase-like enzyme